MAHNNCLVTELKARRQMLALPPTELAARSGIDEQSAVEVSTQRLPCTPVSREQLRIHFHS